MKKIFIQFFLLLSFTSLLAQNTEKDIVSVLFIGNSYTYFNNGVDQVLKLIASSKGNEIDVVSYSPGGYSFEEHSTNTNTLDYIQSREWDYVVLQEQSLKPAFPPSQVETETYPYAQILCDSIHNNSICTTPVFFMTWGRKNGDAGNCAVYPPICTYEGMQWRLRQSYCEMALDNNGIVSPVGMVWKSIRESNPDIELYQSDESHPTNNGTYVAACTFYATIFNKSPLGADFPEEIDEQTATLIQNTAWNVITDSLNTWLIDTTSLRVDFEPYFLLKNTFGYFTNYSENADSCLWNFGDESNEWQYPITPNNWDQITHLYTEEAEYEICLTAYKGCESKTLCKNIYIWASNKLELSLSKNDIYPNPITNGVLYAPNFSNLNFSIYTIEGKFLFKSKIKENKLLLQELNNGFYILVIESNRYKIYIQN